VAFEYVSVEEAIDAPGLRMVVVGGIPSPWGEAAKGILYVKNLDWKGVRLDYDNKQLAKWAGGRNGPVVFYEHERPRSSWSKILILAERLAPQPALIPEDATERAMMFGFSHEILAEAGLCWSRRLQLIHAGMHGQGGFAPPVAQYLSKKYGYRSDSEPTATQRVVSMLGALATRLQAQQAAGSDYFMGDTLTALDIYSATAMALFDPLPPDKCEMHDVTRSVFEYRDAETDAALDPVLLEHRDRIYERHLELPLAL
jgi:glutathione S-transferase